MKRSLSVCLALFVFSLSVSFAYAFLDNLLFFIVYSAVILVISFGILYESTNECYLLKHGYCFKLLFNVVVAFMSAVILVFVSSVLFVLLLVCFSDEPVMPAFSSTIEFIQIVCMPFLVVVLEAAIVMLVKNAKVCPKMKWFIEKSSHYLWGDFF